MSNKVTNMLLYYVKYMRYYIVVELESINCCVSQTKWLHWWVTVV